MEQKQEIIIDLEGLEKTEALEAENLIYRRDFEILSNEIVSLVVENKKAKDRQLMYQPCFFINGSRGSGKTTLLRALQKKICDTKSDEPRIRLLAEIDPTELSEGEEFFVYIISFMQRMVDNIARSCDEDDCKDNL
ncbi:MAG: hypothetical protein IKK92_10705 [Prevotella sp.]|nr:hypothetical protein [Prevotella sp.]